MKEATRTARWVNRLSNVALVAVVGLLVYRWVLPHGSDPLGDLDRQAIFPPGQARLVELGATY